MVHPMKMYFRFLTVCTLSVWLHVYGDSESTLWVSVNGSDVATCGTSSFSACRTLLYAQHRARQLPYDRPKQIRVLPGMYSLDAPLTFTQADGSPDTATAVRPRVCIPVLVNY